MERSRQSLADLLADDTGNLRPEVADFVMTGRLPRPQRPVREIRYDRLPRWLILGFSAVLLFFSVSTLCSNKGGMDTKTASTGVNEMKGTVPLKLQVEDKVLPVRIRLQPENEVIPLRVELEPKKITRPAEVGRNVQEHELTILGKGRVQGSEVNIRQYPSTESGVIRKADEGEILTVLSFVDGWHHVSLGENETGYIFGAYIMPIDFELSSYMVGIARDNSRVLLVADRTPGFYQVILPSGEVRRVREGEVHVIRQSEP